MYTIKTKLGAEHLELIKIFFNANDLSVYVSEYKEQMGPEFHSMLQIEYDNNNDDIASKLTILALKNYGLNNLLDDFLLKCGVSVYDLEPKSLSRYYRSLKE